MGKFHLLVFITLGFIQIADGAELIIISFLAEVREKDWNLSSFDKVMLSTSLYVGYLVGSFVIGPITDAIGRKKPILISTMLLFVGGICSAMMPNFTSFAITRALIGVGIGMIASAGTTYACEMYPGHCRGKIL